MWWKARALPWASLVAVAEWAVVCDFSTAEPW